MDVLASGPERPPRDGLVRWLRYARRRLGAAPPAGRYGDDPAARPGDGRSGGRGGARSGRRWATLTVAALAAAGAVATLRAGAEPVPPRAGMAETPRPHARYRVLPRPPPYDQLPGRTPIPAPRLVSPDWQIVRGRLPPVGRPGRPAAQRAAELVVGRYCLEPAGLAAEVTPDPGWTWVAARVFSRTRSNNPPVVTFRLIWTGDSYDWTGSHTELLSCS